MTKASTGTRVLIALGIVLITACTWIWTRSAATVPRASPAVLRLDTGRPGSMFVPGAVGLSTEAWELSSGRLGADHPTVVRLMRLLGPSVLRIGGNSVDLSWWTSSGQPPPPWATNTVTPADLSALRVLLNVTGWRVLLGVDLNHFEPARVADEARFAQKILGPKLVGIEMGNEPDSFSDKSKKLRASTYGVGDYQREVEGYRHAFSVTTPSLAVYGPAAVRTPWLTEMGSTADIFTVLTQHYYPIPNQTCLEGPPSATVVSPTAAELLSPSARELENGTLEALARASIVADRPTRIGETGTGACRGNSSSSAVFASALWSMDWVLRAASSGVTGVNFHGHLGFCGPYNQSPICAETHKAAKTGDVTAQPEYYGLLAAKRLEGGRFAPTSLTNSESLPNLTTWATIARSGTVKIAIDNLAIGGVPQAVTIPMRGYTATQESLKAPSADTRHGITFGGVRVASSGRWRPKAVKLTRMGNAFDIAIRPATAVVITLHPAHQ